MLFENITMVDENFEIVKNAYVGTDGNKIAYVGTEEPEKDYGDRYCGKNKLLLPGFVNAHCHTPMTLLRGYAENMALHDWLTKKIFPFEDKLTADDVYNGSVLAYSEMLRFGVTTVSDMYFFGDEMAHAALDSGAKVNLSIATMSDEGQILKDLPEHIESCRLLDKYGAQGKARVEFAIHAEYTSTPSVVEEVAAYANSLNLRINIHLSETRLEHEACKTRHGMTPAQYFEEHGLFKNPTYAAHCVFLEKEDREILKRNNVSVVCCPVSNLKLASGFCDIQALLNSGINVGIGTDGASSNNNLNILEEIKLFSIMGKAVSGDASAVSAKQALYAGTRGSALAMGRTDCGIIAEGKCADIVIVDMDKEYMCPVFNPIEAVVYSALGSDVCLTMVDGQVLYKDGEHIMVDIERVKYHAQVCVDNILNRLG